MFPNDVPHDVLSKGTTILVEVFSQLPSIANSYESKHYCYRDEEGTQTSIHDLSPSLSLSLSLYLCCCTAVLTRTHCILKYRLNSLLSPSRVNHRKAICMLIDISHRRERERERERERV
jgi:hypothetical protein